MHIFKKDLDMTKKVKKETSLIVLKAASSVGKLGSLINVKSGYARNFLIPNNIATLATPAKIKFFETKQKEIEKIERLNFEKFLNVKEKLESCTIFTIQKRVNDNDIIFGKITRKNILELIQEELGIELEQTMVNLPNIETLGEYDIPIELTPALTSTINLNVISQ